MHDSNHGESLKGAYPMRSLLQGQRLDPRGRYEELGGFHLSREKSLIRRARNAVQLYFSRVSSSVNIYLVFSFHFDEFQVTRAL